MFLKCTHLNMDDCQLYLKLNLTGKVVKFQNIQRYDDELTDYLRLTGAPFTNLNLQMDKWTCAQKNV